MTQQSPIWWRSPDRSVLLLHGAVETLLPRLEDRSIDLAFADPPYFLSNGGSTCQAGARVKVDKGQWDRDKGDARGNYKWTKKWLSDVRRVLRPNGAIWVSGTSHVIYSVGFAMQQLGYDIVNDVTWEKPNPPPNLACRCFTHDHETLIWAARSKYDCAYHFDYAAMKAENGDKQMKAVWRMSAPSKAEKKHGKHPTQKPEALLERILAASCPPGGTVLDPFNGSGTTGVVAVRRGLKYIGIDQNEAWLTLTKARLLDARPDWA
jgi:site-specific DNA-methyltransferase (adenine-specific)